MRGEPEREIDRKRERERGRERKGSRENGLVLKLF